MTKKIENISRMIGTLKPVEILHFTKCFNVETLDAFAEEYGVEADPYAVAEAIKTNYVKLPKRTKEEEIKEVA